MNAAGRWRIVEMERWDHDAIDLLGPAFIEIGPGHNGSFRFIAVEGWLDVREVERDGVAGVEFSWEGNDECDEASDAAGRPCRATARRRVASSSTRATTPASTPSERARLRRAETFSPPSRQGRPTPRVGR